MQAYATPATGSSPLRLVDSQPAADQTAVLDLILVDQLAARVADQITAKLTAAKEGPTDHWLDSRGAAEYLGISRDSIRRLAAEGSLPTEQAGANCKLYFRHSDLDVWRRSGSMPAAVRRAA